MQTNQPGANAGANQVVSYRKSAPAQRSYALYTAGRPASWDVLVDGVVRGSLRGVARQYSRDVSYVVSFDGRRVRQSAASLRSAKALVAEAVRYGAAAPHWFYLRDVDSLAVEIPVVSSSDQGAKR